MDPCLSVEAGHENTKTESSGTSSTKGGSESSSTSNEESSSSSSSQGSSNTEGSSNSDTSSDSTSLNQGTSRDVSQVKSDLSSLNMFDNINNESGDFALAKSPLSPNPMLKEGLAHHKE